jgi:hypothetical protein
MFKAIAFAEARYGNSVDPANMTGTPITTEESV